MRRKAVLVLAAAAALWAYVGYLRPLPEKAALLKEQLQAEYVTLIKHERFIERTRAAGAEGGGALEDVEEMEKRIVQARDKPLAFAELQAGIQDMASAAGLRISSIKLMPVVNSAGYTELPIDVDSTGDVGNLSAFLNSVDSREAMIGIKSLDVSLVPKDKIRVKMVLSGLMRTP